MSLVRNSRTKNWEADIRSDGLGRLHVSLRTKKKSEADDRHAAVKALFLEGNHDLISALRAGKVKIEAVTRVYQTKKPFDSLVAVHDWPTLEEATESYITWMEKDWARIEQDVRRAERNPDPRQTVLLDDPAAAAKRVSVRRRDKR
jgi:hypothetical protein